MNINNLFFELIQVALGVRVSLSLSPAAEEWKMLYDIAKKQSLVGICFVGVQKLGEGGVETSETLETSWNIPELLYLTWMGMAAKIQQRNEMVNRQCVEVQQMIEKEDFCTYIMKGQGNAALYHDNLKLLRQSGDIDIYLEGGFEKVNGFVQRTCPTNEINELEIHYHCLPDTEVEIHYRPFIMRNPFKNRRLQRFFNEAMRFDNKLDLPNGAGAINVPTAEFNLVHQMVHIAHHLYTDGIGFRQLMDYHFVVKHEMEVEKGLSVREVKKVISELGLARFASALMWVLGHVFGLNREQMLWQPNEKDGRLLLNEVIKSGNFGHMDETKADLSNKWKSFWYVNGKTFRFWRFDHWAWFWSPLWRAYHFAWRKSKGFR